jgi:hypothetical protein
MLVLALSIPTSPSDPRYYFWVDECILLSVSTVLAALFALQWYVEQFQDEKVTSANVKVYIHKLGLTAAVMGIVQNLDTWGFVGIYPNWLADVFTAEISCVLVTCLILLFRTIVVTLYRAHLKRPPIWVTVVMWAYIVSLFLAATLCVTLGLALQKWWIVGYWLLFIGFALILLNLLFLAVTIMLVVLMSKLRRDAGLDTKWHKKFWQRIILLVYAILFAVLAAAVVPSQIVSGLAKIKEKKGPYSGVPFQYGYDPSLRLFTYIMWAFAIYILYVSWMPLKFSNKKREEERILPSEHNLAKSRNGGKQGVSDSTGAPRVASDGETETTTLLRPSRQPAPSEPSTSKRRKEHDELEITEDRA